MKFVSLLSVVATACLVAGFRIDLDQEADLDGNGQFILRWGFPANTGDIEMEFQVNCTGWVGLTLTAPAGNDLIYAGFNESTGRGYLQDRYLNKSGSVTGGTIDASLDVVLKSAIYREPFTIVRIVRSLFTGDDEDVPIVPGPMAIEWAYSFTDNIEDGHPIDTRGRTNVTFIPA